MIYNHEAIPEGGSIPAKSVLFLAWMNETSLGYLCSSFCICQQGSSTFALITMSQLFYFHKVIFVFVLPEFVMSCI